MGCQRQKLDAVDIAAVVVEKNTITSDRLRDSGDAANLLI